MGWVYHSHDLTSAMLQCDKDLFATSTLKKKFEIARVMRPMSLTFASNDSNRTETSFEYYSSPLCSAEFLIGQGDIEIDPMKRGLQELLSTNSFEAGVRHVRFVVPAKPSEKFSILLHQVIERYGGSGKNMFIVVTTTPGHLDKRVLSRLAQRRVPSQVKVDMGASMLSFVAKRGREKAANKIFEEAHVGSYRLCGSLTSVTDLAHAIVRNSNYDPKVLSRVAAIEALKYKTQRQSMLFDSLLCGVRDTLPPHSTAAAQQQKTHHPQPAAQKLMGFCGGSHLF